MWVLKVKYYPDGSIERDKARLVVIRFSQLHSIDNTETFVPTIKQKLLRIFLVIITLLKMILLQIDIVDTYLKSVLEQNN